MTGDIDLCHVIRGLLSNRRFFVQLNDKKSRWRNQKNGFPQGSVLAPLLLYIYTNDQPLPTDCSKEVSWPRCCSTYIPTINLCIRTAARKCLGPVAVQRLYQRPTSAYGLPQGSVLAPLLFNVYTNDQPLHTDCRKEVSWPRCCSTSILTINLCLRTAAGPYMLMTSVSPPNRLIFNMLNRH